MEADKVKWFVIVNPVAGGGRGLDHFPQISKLLRDAHIVCEPVFTEHKFHATELTVSAVKEGYRNIIVVGGDGTLHEVVNGLFIQQEVCPSDVLLAVVAVGTGNDWVRTFGISNRYQDAVKAIGEGYSFLQDVGVVSYEESHYRQSRYMANVAGAGFDARMVRKLSHLKKKGRKSRWRSTWCLVKNFFRYKSTGVKVWIDDRLVYNNLLMSIAIGVCKYNGGHCAIDDDMREILEQMLGSDLLLFSYPLYCYGMPAGLKNLIDRTLPLSSMAMKEVNGRYIHVDQRDYSHLRYLMICGCGFPISRRNFEPAVRQFELLFPNNHTILTVPESPMFNAPEAAVVTVPRLELVRRAGRQYAQTGQIDTALLAEIGSPMIPEELYAKIVNGTAE